MSYVTTELISENQEEPNTFQEAEELEVDTELISEELLLTSLSESSFEDDMEEELLIDETLSPLEKISLYVRSELAFHRVFIAKEFPALIRDVEVSEALEYVLPLIISLGTDPEDHVKEAFATQLDDIIWFYYSHCTLREAADCSPIDIVDLRPPTTQISQTLQRPQTPIQHYNSQQTSSQTPSPANNTPYLSPSAFTFLLRALLLDQNTRIAQAAQATIQSLVERVLEELGVKSKKKDLLEKEILEGVVLGIGRLDQEKFRKEEINEWEHYGDEHGVSTVSGREEEAELGRITMMSLISSLAPIVGPERCTRLFLPELEKMINEQVFYVRKEAALALGTLSGVLPLDIIISKLLPIYDHFSNDAIWHVRRSCCLILPTICSRLPDEMKSERATSGIELFAGDVSRSVRSAAGDIIGELIALFYPNGKVPETVVLTLGESRWDDLKETYLLLTRDIQAKVRRSLSYSLHEIARVIGPKKAEECLLAVFTLYLVDADEVQSGVVENLASFISCLPQKARNNCLPPLFGIWDDLKQRWRLRNTIARQMPTICRLFDSRNVINYLLPLAIKAVKDDVATVRETAIACVTLFEVVYNDDTLFAELINCVREFAFENKFRSRVAFIQICRALVLSAFPKPEFERYFIPILKNFSTDNVVNVRITLVRLIRDLCRIEQYYQDPMSKSQIIDMIKQLAEDPDFDTKSSTLKS
ncbi:19759_t:CDS:10 [Entrophospora sp. SA101]|nr:19759_t:CDS:10 [Entrophospora sp. SA101]